MFIVTTKFNAKKAVCGVAIIGAIAVGIGFFLSDSNTQGVDVEKNMDISAVEAVKIKSPEDRIAFLNSLGWEVVEQPLEIVEVTIPKEFDELYLKYNELQKQQGFDLEKVQGKRATLYIYEVTNHPSDEKGVTANILIYKNKIIAGDISSSDPTGFIHGLGEKPENEKKSTNTETEEKKEETPTENKKI